MAKWRNTAPLHRRFVSVALPEHMLRSNRRKRTAAIIAALKDVPGWDADGRPVEP